MAKKKVKPDEKEQEGKTTNAPVPSKGKTKPKAKPLSTPVKEVKKKLKKTEKVILKPKKKKTQKSVKTTPVSKKVNKKQKKTAVVSDSKKKEELKPLTLKKRGRPKKRGRKRGTKNRIVNNYIHTRSVCWKKYKDYFEGFFDPDFIWIVRQVHIECKSQPTQCPDDKIFQFFDIIYEQWKNEKRREQPEIPEGLLTPLPYYEIDGITWERLDSYLWIVADMICPFPHEFEMIDYVNREEYIKEEKQIARRKAKEKTKGRYSQTAYQKWFAKWVNWCNKIHSEKGIHDSSEILIHFKFTASEWNKELERWECYLVPCTSSGIIDSFGYTPDTENDVENFDLPDEPEPVIPETPVTPTTEPVVTGKTDWEAEKKRIEIEEYKKKELLSRLLEAKKFQLDEIKMWKDIGEKEELKNAITKLKQINQQIDSLLS